MRKITHKSSFPICSVFLSYSGRVRHIVQFIPALFVDTYKTPLRLLTLPLGKIVESYTPGVHRNARLRQNISGKKCFNMKKLFSILAAIMLLLCACSQGGGDNATVTRGKKGSFTPSGQKVESSIFGRNIKYDSFTPVENISMPIDSADITDMLQIEKVLYFLTNGAVYTLDIESGASGKLFETDATMFASYGSTLYTYAPESEKLCAYSTGGEVISVETLALQNEALTVEDFFVTDDYYSFKCWSEINHNAPKVMQHHVFDHETLEQVNTIDEKTTTTIPFRVFSSYKGNSLLKVEESPMDSRSVDVYEIDLEAGKIKRVATAAFGDDIGFILDFAYNPKADTVVFFVAPKRLFTWIDDDNPFEGMAETDPIHDSMYISECSLSDPDNIIHVRFYPDEFVCDSVFVSVYENIVSAISSANNEYSYFDYLNPPESITLACQRAEFYEDIIEGFEKETGIMVRTVSYGLDLDRLDIKLMAGDADFDLFEPIYYNQHKYFLADMFEDLSKYEGLKQRFDGDLAAGYVSNLDGKYVGIPTGMQNIGTKDVYPEDGTSHSYSLTISRFLYLANNIDIADGVYKDTDGSELYKLLKFLYDYPEGNESKMPFGKAINVLENGFVLMNPSGTHKENTVKFLEYMFDALNGDIDGITPEWPYIDIDSTDGYYVYWRFFAWDYVGPIYEAANTISQCDGKNGTLKEIARKAAAEVRMRLME